MRVAGMGSQSLHSDCREGRGVPAVLGTTLVCYLRRTWARLSSKPDRTWLQGAQCWERRPAGPGWAGRGGAAEESPGATFWRSLAK